MVVKIANKSSAAYMYADEVTSSKVYMDNWMEGYDGPNDMDDPSAYQEKYNYMVHQVQSKANIYHKAIVFKVDVDYEELGILLCIDLKDKDIVVTNQATYLMTDSGQTIERLL